MTEVSVAGLKHSSRCGVLNFRRHYIIIIIIIIILILFASSKYMEQNNTKRKTTRQGTALSLGSAEIRIKTETKLKMMLHSAACWTASHTTSCRTSRHTQVSHGPSICPELVLYNMSYGKSTTNSQQIAASGAWFLRCPSDTGRLERQERCHCRRTVD